MSKCPIFINCFEVPAGREDEFLVVWTAVNNCMRRKPGSLSNRLHGAVTPKSRNQRINDVEWATVEHRRAAARARGTRGRLSGSCRSIDRLEL